MTIAMGSKELLKRLERHYLKPGPLPGGIFVPEVGWNGAAGNRADALYVGFTSTSGRRLVGHELKVSRADWRHELDQPGKADAWHDQCHAWYVVAPSTDIVPPEELPDGWGLMVVNPRTTTRLDVKVRATVHGDRTPSWYAVRSIMARQDTLRAQAIGQIQREAYEKALIEVQGRELKRIQERAADSGRQATQTLAQIEEAFGCSFTDWRHDNLVSPSEFGDALRIAKARSRLVDRWDGIRGVTESMERLKGDLDALRQTLQEVTAA